MDPDDTTDLLRFQISKYNYFLSFWRLHALLGGLRFAVLAEPQNIRGMWLHARQRTKTKKTLYARIRLGTMSKEYTIVRKNSKSIVSS